MLELPVELLPGRSDDGTFPPEIGEIARELASAACREDFWKFRCAVHPELILCWWQEHMSRHFMQFWRDFLAGRRPKLLLQAPPQHGKSDMVTDFIAWIAGKNPDLKTIFTSYSDDLGVGTNKKLQRLFVSEEYRNIFWGTNIAAGSNAAIRIRYKCNESMIEYILQKGSFRNTTVEGQITGQGLHIGVVDDPMKGRKEASSLVKRDSTWAWLTDDFFSRFSDDAGMLMIMTRWHVDDPVGRWLEKFPETKVFRYPAIADEDDWSVQEGYREVGEPLFPEHKSLDYLMERKKLLTQAGWESIYQQNPIIVGGGMFPIDMFEMMPVEGIPRSMIKRSVRYFDKAGTEDGGAYTAGTLMHLLDDGKVLVEDVRRGQWAASERERRILQTAHADRAICPRRYEVWVEQEPGSGGKESAENTVRMLKGFLAFADKVTGSSGPKETRAEPYAAQVQQGNVILKPSTWNRDFLDEHETFPNGKYLDQVDSAAGAFNKLVMPESTYDPSMSWY